MISNAQIGQDKREESKFNFRMTPIHDIQMTKASPFFVLLPALTFNNPLQLGDYFKLDIDLTIDLDNEHMYIYKVSAFFQSVFLFNYLKNPFKTLLSSNV